MPHDVTSKVFNSKYLVISTYMYHIIYTTPAERAGRPDAA